MEKKRSVKIEKSPFHKGGKYYVVIDNALHAGKSSSFLGLGTKEEAKKDAKNIRKMFRMGFSLEEILNKY